MCVDIIDEPVLVSTHSEKIVGLPDHLGNSFVVRTSPVYQLTVCVETLTSKTVCAFVFAEVDIFSIIDFLQDFLDHLHVGRVCGAYEVIIFYVEFRPQRFEKITDLVRINQRTQAFSLGCLHYLVTMFICPCQKIGLTTAHPVESIQDIGYHCGVGMTQVRTGIYVIDRCCNVKQIHAAVSSIIWSKPTSTSSPSSVLIVIDSFNMFCLTTFPVPFFVRTYFPDLGNLPLRSQ